MASTVEEVNQHDNFKNTIWRGETTFKLENRFRVVRKYLQPWNLNIQHLLVLEGSWKLLSIVEILE